MVEIKVNRKAKELDIYLNGEKVETLKGKEAYEWLKNANRIYTYNGDLFGVAYVISLKDLDEIASRCEQTINDLVAIDFIGEDMIEFGYSTFKIMIEFANGTKEETKVNVEDNFDHKRGLIGYLEAGQLKSCFDQETLDFITHKKECEILYNGGKIDKEEFFEENSYLTFEFEENHDS